MGDLVKPDGTGPAFSPTISYNPKSGPAGLGKELWHASEHLKGVNLPPVDPRSGALTPLQQWDVNGASVRDRIEMELRKSVVGRSDAIGNQE